MKIDFSTFIKGNWKKSPEIEHSIMFLKAQFGMVFLAFDTYSKFFISNPPSMSFPVFGNETVFPLNVDF